MFHTFKIDFLFQKVRNKKYLNTNHWNQLIKIAYFCLHLNSKTIVTNCFEINFYIKFKDM